ncbi:hypothetical protein GQ457_05G017920 [Hibiscus cannabinus]
MANILASTKLQPWWLLFVSLLFVSNAEPQVPCYFIFGDSLSDDGNNNDLSTTAKVNYSPYGIDFPKGPTGRFTNGRTMQDIIGLHFSVSLLQLLDFQEFIPPFATSSGQEILKGVDYASGSAGILNETGQQVILYNNGARMLALFGIGSIGCTPNAIALYGTNGSACVEKMNSDAQLFNERLVSLVDELNTNLTDAKFTYVYPSGTTSANSLGFTVTNASCCKIESGRGLCIPDSEPCSDRN